MTDTVVVLIRSLAAYVTLFLLARMMGKQVIAQVTFFEFVVGIMIGDIAATMAMDIHSVSFAEGLVAMLVMAGVTVVLSAVQLKSPRARNILEGSPTILIENGRILKRNLLKERFTLQDLKSQLRLQKVFTIEEVETAILEPNGHVSVQLKQEYETVRWRDLESHPAFSYHPVKPRISLKSLRAKRLMALLLQAEAIFEGMDDSPSNYRQLARSITSIRESIAGRLE